LGSSSNDTQLHEPHDFFSLGSRGFSREYDQLTIK